MDLLRLLPLLAVILLNAAVLLYVVRERDRTRSGFFLSVNALSLVIWSVGRSLWLLLGEERWALVLPAFATLLIPANFLYFAATRPRPARAVWASPVSLVTLFLPAVILALLDTYVINNEMLRENPSFGWGGVRTLVGELSLLYTFTWLSLTIATLLWRYRHGETPLERLLAKHLIVVVCSPFLFTAFMALTMADVPQRILPSPGLLLVIIGQVGLVMVIRQEELHRPLYLSRWIYYVVVAITGFTVSYILYTLYESVTATVLHVPTVQLFILASVLTALMVAQAPQLQNLFDRLVFRRAFEHQRGLVRAAHGELRDARERLRHAERLSVVGEIAARVAHEIKNPLGPIKGYTQMMRERMQRDADFPNRDAFLRQLDVIAEEVEAIDSKVRQLLDLARGPALVREEVDVRRLLERAAILTRLEAAAGPDDSTDSRRIVVVEEHGEGVPPISADRHRMEEALFNLCSNSLHALGGAGRIVLRSRADSSPQGRAGVTIEVLDDGPGLTDDARAHLFEPFHTHKPQGTGLGLSIVKTHVEAHGGRVGVENIQPRGTCVSLWLPVEGVSTHDSREISRWLANRPPTPRLALEKTPTVGAAGET